MKNLKIALWLAASICGVLQTSDSSKSDKIIIKPIGDYSLKEAVIETWILM
jgi:hypothetical protein